MYVKVKMYKCIGYVICNFCEKMSENVIVSNIEWYINKSVYVMLYEVGVEDVFGDFKFI